MTTFAPHYTLKASDIVRKFRSTKIDDDLKKTLSELWQSKPEHQAILSMFTDWLTNTVAAWSASGVTYGPHSVHFCLKLAALLCTDEETFSRLNNNNFFVRLIKATKARETQAPRIKMAYVGLLGAFLEHEAGVEWFAACNFWEDVLDWGLLGDAAVVRESRRLLGKILERAVVHDEAFCDRVAKKMLAPLGESVYRCVKGVNEDVEMLQSTLRLLGDVLEHFLRGVYFDGKNFRVLFVFLRNFHLEGRICDLMMVAQDKRLVFDLSKIMFVMQFLELYADVLTGGTTMTKASAAVVRIKNNFTANLYRGTFLEQVDFCPFGILYWKVLEAKIPAVATTKARFSDQLSFILTMPPGCLIIKDLVKLTDLEEAVAQDEFRSALDTKMWENISDDFVRVMYFWYQRISDDSDIFSICRRSLVVFKKCLDCLSKNQAVMVFQAFVYFLLDLVNVARQNPAKVELLVQRFPNIVDIFELLGTVTKLHQIGLKDGIETTYVVTLCFDFLALTEWASDVVVAVVDLINVGTAHYMAPSLALLVDDTPGSTIALLGPLLYSKLLGHEARVKRAALEVVCTIARISSTKYKISKLVAKWVKKAATKWSGTKIPSLDLIVFMVDLTRLLTSSEKKFADLKRSDNFFSNLFAVVKKSKPGLLIGLLMTFLEHKAGTTFIFESNLWKHVFDLSYDDETLTQCASFVSTLLDKIVDDDDLRGEIVEAVVLPLGDDVSLNHLKFVSALFEHLLAEVCANRTNFDVPVVFLKCYKRVSNFVTMTLSKSFVLDLSKVRLTMQLLEVFDQTASTSATSVSIDEIKSAFLTNFSKQSFDEVIEFSKFGSLYWRVIESKVPHLAFSDQIVATFLIPHYGFVLRNCLSLSKLEEACRRDEIRDGFVAKIVKMLGDTTRLHFMWRDRMMESPRLVDLCRKSLRSVKECRYYLSRYQAVVIFQTLIYLVKDMVLAASECEEKKQVVRKEKEYVGDIFDLMTIFVEEIRITWKDIVESVELVNVCFEFLAVWTWPEEMVVQVLTLVNVATKKYMLPSLMLLVDSTEDSTVALLGRFLKQKMGESVGVRKAALEVVCTLADLSREKFPSLQKVLMDSELPTLVVKMSTCDSESFVRATAIKCLQEMIQVEEIWNNALKTEDLWQKMRDVLLNETEGIVRVEAATFMCVMYEHQQFPADSLDAIYETMIHASTADLHWEVKVRALAFWDKVITTHLQNQGMIDGSFPNVTFSKEHRKIVTLTDAEIRKRLLKVLAQLGAVGCLGVLTAAVRDDCDAEVCRAAAAVTQRLAALLRRHGVGGGSAPASPAPESVASASSGVSVDESMDSPRSSQPDLSEEVIEQIVGAKDAALLRGVYAPSDYGSVSNYDFQVRRVVTPAEFLRFAQQDLDAVVAEKKKWLSGIEDLGSLLDDMLKAYDDDVNGMDCY